MIARRTNSAGRRPVAIDSSRSRSRCASVRWMFVRFIVTDHSRNRAHRQTEFATGAGQPAAGVVWSPTWLVAAAGGVGWYSPQKSIALVFGHCCFPIIVGSSAHRSGIGAWRWHSPSRYCVLHASSQYSHHRHVSHRSCLSLIQSSRGRLPTRAGPSPISSVFRRPAGRRPGCSRRRMPRTPPALLDRP